MQLVFCGDVWSIFEAITRSVFNALSLYLQCLIHGPPTPSLLSFSVLILFHNLSCCNDRLRQRALCWCLWAEPLRGWDKAKLTSGFSCVTVSFETVSEKAENEGKACSSRGGPPLHFTYWLLLACSCLLLPRAASSNNVILILQTYNIEVIKQHIHPE